MTVWTIISTAGRLGIGLPRKAFPFAAIRGPVEVVGNGIHVTSITADSASEAMAAVRGVVIPDANNDVPLPTADRWTVIGKADNGPDPTWWVLAVVAGEHEVEGDYRSAHSHRWARVVDAPTANAADLAGERAAAEYYEKAWN